MGRLQALEHYMLQDIHLRQKQLLSTLSGRQVHLLKIVEVVVVVVHFLLFFHLLKLLKAQILLQSILHAFMVQLLQTMALD
jgi:hypothetical protein